MNVVVIEDEQAASRRLIRMIEKQGLKVIASLDSVKEAIQWFRQHEHPELIFLDIQLSDGLSFSIFDAVQTSSAIIFTTAFDAYALQAFKLNSIDYLLKPIDEEELNTAIDQYQNIRYPNTFQKFDFEDIKKMLYRDKATYKDRFSVDVGAHIKILSVPEIVCFYSENKGTYALLDTGRSYLMGQSMESLLSGLDPAIFFRISRQAIVQLSYIKDIVNFSSTRLKIMVSVATPFDLVVSRERVKDFKLWIS